MCTPEQFMEFFNEADTEQTGFIDLTQLKEALRRRGYQGPDSLIETYFRQVDTSGDEKISKEEYKIAMGLVPQKDHMEAAMRSCFRQFDTDNSGSITADELKKVFEEMGKNFSMEEMERMIQLADEDNSGTLEYEEFIKKCFGR